MSVGGTSNQPKLDHTFIDRTYDKAEIGVKKSLFVVGKDGEVKVVSETEKKTSAIKSSALSDVAKSMEGYLKNVAMGGLTELAYLKKQETDALKGNVGLLNKKIEAWNRKIDGSFWATVWEKTLGRLFGSQKIQTIQIDQYVTSDKIIDARRKELETLYEEARRLREKANNQSYGEPFDANISRALLAVVQKLKLMGDPISVDGALQALLVKMSPNDKHFYDVLKELDYQRPFPMSEEVKRQMRARLEGLYQPHLDRAYGKIAETADNYNLADAIREQQKAAAKNEEIAKHNLYAKAWQMMEPKLGYHTSLNNREQTTWGIMLTKIENDKERINEL